MQKIIGTVTRYHGTELRFLRGYQVLILAVIRGGERPDFDPERDDTRLDSDEELAAVGGVTADDTVIVQPWIEQAGRFSFVSSDPAAVDLECFAHLKAPTTPQIDTISRKRTHDSAPKIARRPSLAPKQEKDNTMTIPTIAELQKQPIKELKARIAEISGQQLKSNNRPYLAKKLAGLLEAQAAEAKADATSKAEGHAGHGAGALTGRGRKRNAPRDRRLPAPGTVLTRNYKGATIAVEVGESDFRYNGKSYRSLSTVARVATGTIWNGFTFFGLSPARPRRNQADNHKAAA